MRLFRIRIVALCAFVAAVCALAGCSVTTTSVQEGASNRRASIEPVVTEGLKQEGALTIGIRGSSVAPFVITSINSLDTSEGIDIELGCAIADELGLPASFVSVDNVATALVEKCDIVMNVSGGEANGFDVACNYAEMALSLFHQGEPTVASADEVAGKRIAVQEGSAAQMALRVTALEAQEVPCSTLNEAFDALEAGEADYVLCQATSGAYLTQLRDDLSFAGAFSEPTAQGIALASGDGPVQSAVKTAFAELEGNGVLAEIRRSWLGELSTLTSESVIADIPMRETDGESLDAYGGSSEVLQSAMDGSTAGANAVSWAEAQSLGASSTGGTTTTQTTQQYTPTYNYDYYSTYEYSAPTYYAPQEVAYDDSSAYGDGDYGGEALSYDAGSAADYGDGGGYAESLEQ